MTNLCIEGAHKPCHGMFKKLQAVLENLSDFCFHMSTSRDRLGKGGVHFRDFKFENMIAFVNMR